MKSGDKVLCTADFYSSLQLMFSKNKIYTIIRTNKDKDRLTLENNKYGLSFFYTDKKHIFYLFDDYFITQQEHRKQKLEKLNENR